MIQTEEEIQLGEFRAMREEAWRIVKADLDRLRGDLADRGIGERIKDKIGEEAHEAWDYTVDVAAQNKGVVAATVAALIAWLLRGPIGDALSSLLGRDEEQERGESVEPGEGDAT